MNREIKFRAWIKEEKIMTDVKNLYYDNNGLNKVTGRQKLRMITRRPFEDSLIGDFELMQYTGLKDKNDVEIYEGDIVKGRYYAGYNIGIKRIIGSVGWTSASFKVNGVKQYEGTRIDFDGSFEVIGNIYEHQHLLEE